MSPKNPVVSFRLPAELLANLEALAQRTERDKAYLMRKALERYLEQESWHVGHTEQQMLAAELLRENKELMQ